jgi:hypothetical protein
MLFLSGGYCAFPHSSPEHADGRIGTTIIIIIGILFLSVVIAVIVRSVQAKMRALKQGLSPVVERGHTVLLGFGTAALSVIRELALANKSEGGGTVAVLAAGDTVAMARELGTFLSEAELHGTNVVFRNGSRLRLRDLQRVATKTARAVIAVSDSRVDAATADAEVLQVMLNISCMQMDRSARVVAEVQDGNYASVISLIAPRVSVVASHDTVGALLLLFVRQPGLARVYAAVLGFADSEFYVARWPALTGARWSDVFPCFPHAVPIGVRRAGGAVLLNPAAAERLTASDELIVLAEDNDTYTCEPAAVLGARAPAPPPAPPRSAPDVLLVAGWRRDIDRMLSLFDRVANPGSEVHILCPLDADVRAEELSQLPALRNTRLFHHVGSTCAKRDLVALPLARFTGALVLSQEGEGVQACHSDSHGLASLTLLRRLRAVATDEAVRQGAWQQHGQGLDVPPPPPPAPLTPQQRRGARGAPPTPHAPPPPPPLATVVELLDPRTQRTVDASPHVWSVADFTLSNELTSKMLAMISEDLSVKSIVEALTGGADTHLSLMRASACAPAHGGAASFWELARECVLTHGATLIGYVEEDAPRTQLPGAPWVDPGAPPAVDGAKDTRALPRCVINPPDKLLRRRWGETQLVIIKSDKRLRPVEAAPSAAAQAAAENVAQAQAMNAQAQWMAEQQRQQEQWQGGSTTTTTMQQQQQRPSWQQRQQQQQQQHRRPSAAQQQQQQWPPSLPQPPPPQQHW